MDYYCFGLNFYWAAALLIVQHNIWPPDMIGGHVQHVHSSIFIRVPLEFIVVPILKKGRKSFFICTLI
jgi:hypothetical protein